MATPGEIDYKYRRSYVCVNPDPALGPPTWRLSVSQETGNGDSGLYDFDGAEPIDVTSIPDGGRTKVETSLDISQLPDRAD